jgi:hypothetical protein
MGISQPPLTPDSAIRRRQSRDRHEVTIFFDAKREFREQFYLFWSFATTAVWVAEVTLEVLQPCESRDFDGSHFRDEMRFLGLRPRVDRMERKPPTLKTLPKYRGQDPRTTEVT